MVTINIIHIQNNKKEIKYHETPPVKMLESCAEKISVSVTNA